MNDIERANKAKAVLDSPAFSAAFDSVRSAIIDRIEKCPLADSQTAEDMRRCLRLLKDVRINLEAAVNTGSLAAFRLAEDERRRKNPLRNYFR